MICSVLFDAAGTLFETAEPVGETYARFARGEGLSADAAALERAFRAVFVAAPPLAFPAAAASERPALEREWWRKVVFAAFENAGVEGPEDSIRRAFDTVFEHFATADAWRVFTDVRPALAVLGERGCRLAVVSNFDGRLRPLLDRLGLAPFFAAVVLSSECGLAKPDPRIFAAALRALSAEASTTLHVGDSEELDVRAARAAGLVALRIVRRGVPGADTITDLRELGTRVA